jgi:hypothetical protein
MVPSIDYNKTACNDFDDHIEVALNQIFLEASLETGATYMSYTFDYMNKNRYSFRSEPLWASAYHNVLYQERPIIEHCPLDIFSRERKNTILIWDDYVAKEQPRIFREIMGMRSDIGLNHGITLNTYFGHHHDAIALAVDSHKDNLALRILMNDKKELLKKYLLSCRKIIINNYLAGI